MSSYIQGFEDGVRATKAEYLKLLEEQANSEELTDEEIDEVIEMVGYPRTHAMDIYFAREILRKAQEK